MVVAKRVSEIVLWGCSGAALNCFAALNLVGPSNCVCGAKSIASYWVPLMSMMSLCTEGASTTRVRSSLH